MYIVIGASSFIGVYTVDEFLKQGCKVVVTGRKINLRSIMIVWELIILILI